MTYRSGSAVKGHYRNGHWVSPHFRSGTTVRSGYNFYSSPAVPPSIPRRLPSTNEISSSIWGSQTTDTFCANAMCPKCGCSIYFIRHNGGCVWLNSLGWPWPKHECFLAEASAWLSYLQVNIDATESGARVEQPNIVLGVITGIQPESNDGDISLFLASIDCGNGMYVFVEINFGVNGEQFPSPNTVVALNFDSRVVATSTGKRFEVVSQAVTDVRWDLRQDWRKFQINWGAGLDEQAVTIFKKRLTTATPQEARDTDGRTRLMRVSMQGDLDEVKTLLSRGANPNALDNFHQSALYYSTINGNPKVSDLLILNGADTSQQLAAEAMLETDKARAKPSNTPYETPQEARDTTGRTLLMHAAMQGDLEEVKTQLSRGANPNALDNFHQSALYYSTINGNPKVSDLLILNGADTSQQLAAEAMLETDKARAKPSNTPYETPQEARDTTGRTLLMHAAMQGDLEEVKTQLSRGANPNALDNFHQSALYYSTINGNPKVSDLLILNGADTSQKLAAEAMLERDKARAEPTVPPSVTQQEARDTNGRTLLILAAMQGSIEEVKRLLTQGANPNALDNFHQSALYYSTINRNLEVSALLISIGADTSQKLAAEALMDKIRKRDELPDSGANSGWTKLAERFLGKFWS